MYYIILNIVFAAIFGLLFKQYLFWKNRAKAYKPYIDMLEQSHDIVYEVGLYPIVHYKYLSPVFDELMGEGQTKEHLRDPYLMFDRLHPDDHMRMNRKVAGTLDYREPLQWRLLNKDDEYIWFEEHIQPIIENEQIVGWRGLYKNIHQFKLLQMKLEEKAKMDSLTHMYNRSYFDDQMGMYNKLSIPIAIVVCDVNDLKSVNDRYGHKAGDDLICDVANLMKMLDNPNREFYRIGGDEFAIILPFCLPSEAQQFIDELEVLQCQYNEEYEKQLLIAKGYAYVENSYAVMENLYIRADDAMYSNKKTLKKMKLAERTTQMMV